METANVAVSSCSKVPALLREGLSWPLARVAHALVEAHNAALAPLALSMRSYAVLAMVSGGSVRSQLEIAQGVGLDKTTLVATLDDLERRGLVARKPDPEDRRARIVSITCEGERLLAKAGELVRAMEREMLAQMTPAQVDSVRDALEALMAGVLHKGSEGAGSCL